jgi:basic membrane protein A
MKKILTSLLVLLMVFSMVGCQPKEPGGEDENTYDVVFLADMGTIYDGGFNQYSYQGIVDYCEKSGATHTYLQPASDNDEARRTIFEQAAAQMKAKVIVACGFLWDAALCQLIPEYPDVKVVFLDADDLYNIDYNWDGIDDSIEYTDKLAMITFAEQDSGYMAGYAVVLDGYRKLGFFGGMAVPAVVRFGYGFIDGAEAAAKELGLAPGEVEVKYYYTGTFDASPDLVTFVANWYTEGTEIIFACGGQIVNSVIQAAKDGENRWIVGVDTDEYYTRKAEGAENEPLIVTSAMKSLANTVEDAVRAAFEGGDAWKYYTENGLITLTAAEDAAVIAPYRAENWNVLTQEQYDAIYAKTIEVHATIATEADGENGAPIEGRYTLVTVKYIEK